MTEANTDKQGEPVTSRQVWAAFQALLVLLVLVSLLTGCDRAVVTETAAPAPTTPVSTHTGPPAEPTTPVPPTETSEPLAAVVNGAQISMAEYQSEIALYQAATGTEPTPAEQQLVINDLVDRALLAQAADQAGFSLDEAQLDERIQLLVEGLGSQEALSAWMSEYQYDESTFRLALRNAVAAAWMRDQIIAETPKSAEQVRAIQILLYNSDDAAEVLALLDAGNDFGNLAVEYDPITGGDLGWFPRGYLPDAELEQVAFSLAPGDYSPVIETLAGFHILQVIERDPQRVLPPDAYRMLQAQTLVTWLETERAVSDIEILLP
jgi:peptidyl-prolyl cis-trans isomerase C